MDLNQAFYCDFRDRILCEKKVKKVCFPLLGLSVKHVQANRNSQAVPKGFKFHYKSVASTWGLLGAESQWDIFLRVGGSPRWQCLCCGRIALLFVVAYDDSLFFTNWIKSLCLVPVTALTFWNANLWSCFKLEGWYFFIPVPFGIFLKNRYIYCKSLPISMATKHSSPSLCIQVQLFSILFQLRLHNSLIFLL